MGVRRRRLHAPDSEYRDNEGNVLVLRGSMTPGTRRGYASVASGEALAPSATRDDAWHRAFEFLFERLAVSWTIHGAPPLTRQAELLARLRMASAVERTWVRDRLREHCIRFFPDVDAP